MAPNALKYRVVNIDEDWLDIDMIYEVLWPYQEVINERMPLWFDGLLGLGELLSLPAPIEGSITIQSHC